MKKISYFITLLCMMLFASCSSDVEDYVTERQGQSVKNGILTVGINMPGNGDTRISTANLGNLVWEVGDQIVAEGFDSNNWNAKSLGKSTLTLQSGATTSSATFSGNAIKGATYYSYIYAGPKVTFDQYGYNNSDFNEQIQIGANSNHIKDFLYLTTPDKIDVTSVDPIMLIPENPIMRINVKSLPKEIKDANEFEFTTILTHFSNGNDSTKILYKGTLKEENNYIYQMLAYGTQLDGNFENLIFDIKANGQVVTVVIPGTQKVYYDRGKIYTVTLDYNNPGTMDWITPSEPVYDADFKGTFNWTQETTPNTLTGLYIFQHDYYTSTGGPFDALQFDAKRANGNAQPIDSRVISPNITLMKNNELSFSYSVLGIQNVQNANAWFNVCIREVGGEWEILPKKDMSSIGSEVNVKINIPAKYNDKTVQISYTIHSEKYMSQEFDYNLWQYVDVEKPGASYRVWKFKIVHR